MKKNYFIRKIPIYFIIKTRIPNKTTNNRNFIVPKSIKIFGSSLFIIR